MRQTAVGYLLSAVLLFATGCAGPFVNVDGGFVYTCEGRILDASGRPMNNMEVWLSLNPTETDRPPNIRQLNTFVDVYATSTDVDGRFTREVSPGMADRSKPPGAIQTVRIAVYRPSDDGEPCLVKDLQPNVRDRTSIRLGDITIVAAN